MKKRSNKKMLSLLSFAIVISCMIPITNVSAIDIPDYVQTLYRSGIVNVAKEQLDKKYVFGSRGPNSFDCSGLAWYAYSSCGYSIDKSCAANQAKDMHNTSREVTYLKNGYLIFYDYNKKTNYRYLDIDHVSIYIGIGWMIDASRYHNKVVKRSSTIMQDDIVMKARPATYL